MAHFLLLLILTGEFLIYHFQQIDPIEAIVKDFVFAARKTVQQVCSTQINSFGFRR